MKHDDRVDRVVFDLQEIGVTFGSNLRIESDQHAISVNLGDLCVKSKLKHRVTKGREWNLHSAHCFAGVSKAGIMFRNRSEAGRSLTAELLQYRDRQSVMVLALPRGGVPVGYEIAEALHLPLDVFLVRKLGVPGQEELALGALAAGGTKIINQHVVETFSLSNLQINAVIVKEQLELYRLQMQYRDGQPWPHLRDWTVILVDDGLATGATMRAAIAALRQQGPSRIVVAVPVGAPDTCRLVAEEADQLICLEQPDPFRAVGLWYDDFEATTDEEVRSLLFKKNVDWSFHHTAP